MTPATKARIQHEGEVARHKGLFISDCPYDGEKRLIWIQGWSDSDE